MRELGEPAGPANAAHVPEEARLRVPADGPRRRRVERRERLRAHEGARQREAVRPHREGLHGGLVVQDPVLGDRVDLGPDERPRDVGASLGPGDRVDARSRPRTPLSIVPHPAGGSGSNRPTITAAIGGWRIVGVVPRDVGREPDADRHVRVDVRAEVGERGAAGHRPLDLGDHGVAIAQRAERVVAVAAVRRRIEDAEVALDRHDVARVGPWRVRPGPAGPSARRGRRSRRGMAAGAASGRRPPRTPSATPPPMPPVRASRCRRRRPASEASPGPGRGTRRPQRRPGAAPARPGRFARGRDDDRCGVRRGRARRS